MNGGAWPTASSSTRVQSVPLRCSLRLRPSCLIVEDISSGLLLQRHRFGRKSIEKTEEHHPKLEAMANVPFTMEDAKEIKALDLTTMISPADIKLDHRRTESAETSNTSATAMTLPFAELGAPINRSQTAEDISRRKPLNAGLRWPRARRLMREPLSEFLGTFILVMFGDGVVAQVVLSNGEKGDYQSIAWGWVSICSVR